MKLDLEQVRHVAQLARLELSPEAEVRLQGELSRILDAFAELEKVDTAAVPATARLGEQGALRADEVAGELGLERALGNAPQKAGTSFAVPKFVE